MNNNEFQTVGLYDHNVNSYEKIKTAFETGKDVVGIVHATGTGKSYNALQLAYDNKDKKIVYVVPSNGIIEHLKNIIENNPNLDLERDFPNLEFRTYQSFISLSKDEIQAINCDLLILDEFHHLGAPIWGARIDTMIETHPGMKILGMTAYTIRDRGTSYERDMANPDTDELFSGKIESRYDLCDAMIDGVLPKPIYKSAYTNLMGLASKLEERVQRLDASTKEYQEYMAILSDVKRKINEAPSIPNILRKNIKPNGKYIYFCPPWAEEGTNDIETIKKQAFEWFKQFVPEKDIVIYTSTSDMGEDGRKNRDAFYNDVTLDGEKASAKLRVMFAINQYNEGIHAPNIDGVIMGRGTTSDIVYFEQLGRALAVRGNTKDMFEELEKHSVEELIEMCKTRDIHIEENTPKEEIIEKLIAPIVIDLANNYDFIKELENNLKDRIKDIQNRGLSNYREIKIRDVSFDIEIENQDLFEMLKYVSDRLTRTWEDYYELAKKFYEHYDNLEIPLRFKTNDGYSYDENGTVNLGIWISNQRVNFDNLSGERQQALQSIGFSLNPLKDKWNRNYELAKKYYEHYGNLEIPQKFKTNDGYTYDEDGKVNLGWWLANQRATFDNLSGERQQALQSLGFSLNPLEDKWNRSYELAKKYFEHYGNLEIPRSFKTNDGYTYDESGEVNLGVWISNQRRYFDNLSRERQQLLESIGFVLSVYEEKWYKKYEMAKAYYEHYGNLEIPKSFKTNDGYTYDESGEVNLGFWSTTQRKNFDNLSRERQQLLESIGFEPRVREEKWYKKYEMAKAYYEHYDNLEIPKSFKTNDGYTYDENGEVNLGLWSTTQRKNFDNLSRERQQLLESIGFVSSVREEQWFKKYQLAKTYYEYYGNLEIPTSFKTSDGYTYDENGEVNLGKWIANQRRLTIPDSEKGQLLSSIGMIWNYKQNKDKIIDVCKTYNIDEAKNKTILAHISIQELQAKIEFLLSHNIPIIDENGLLNDIFTMSSPDMQEIYGVSLENLINEYYIKNQIGKGV